MPRRGDGPQVTVEVGQDVIVRSGYGKHQRTDRGQVVKVARRRGVAGAAGA